MYNNRVYVEEFRFHENSGYTRNDQLACNSPKDDNAHMCTLSTIILLTTLYAMFTNQIGILMDGEIVEEENANGLM